MSHKNSEDKRRNNGDGRRAPDAPEELSHEKRIKML